MIFIILGTQTVPFYSLTDKIVEFLKANIIQEEVVIQTGYTYVCY